MKCTNAHLQIVLILTLQVIVNPGLLNILAADAKPTNAFRTDIDAKPKPDEHDLKLREFEFKVIEHRWTLLGWLVTVGAFGFGLFQYWKAEKWKRVEFLAKEMKEFFADLYVENALTMIDWSPRRVNLFHKKEPESEKFPVVTRRMQVLALLPHTMLGRGDATDSEADSGSSSSLAAAQSWKEKTHYSPEEARIRDTYDHLFDGLERLASNLSAGLVTKKGLDPYLAYWVNDIASYTKNPEDAEWTCALLAYIEFYDFIEVRKLFTKYGFDIAVSGPLFKRQGQEAPDQELIGQLVQECERKRV